MAAWNCVSSIETLDLKNISHLILLLFYFLKTVVFSAPLQKLGQRQKTSWQRRVVLRSWVPSCLSPWIFGINFKPMIKTRYNIVGCLANSLTFTKSASVYLCIDGKLKTISWNTIKIAQSKHQVPFWQNVSMCHFLIASLSPKHWTNAWC